MAPRDATSDGGVFARVSAPWRAASNQQRQQDQNILPTVLPESKQPLLHNDALVKRSGGSASITSEVLNLVKQIVGAGVLGLPAGIAAFGDHPTSLIPAAVLICAIGTISAYGFALIGRVCHQTNATSYREAWIRTVGEQSSWMPAWACVLVACCSATTFSMVLADTIPSLLRPLLGFVLPRSTALIFVTTFALLPLCLLKELSSLAPFSLVGIAAMVYTAVVMVERYMFGYYDEGSPFVKMMPENLLPSFGDVGWRAVFSPNCAVLVSMISQSFLAHYNAPKFFWELRNNTINRYDAVVAASFFGSMMLMSIMCFAGFATFGAASQGLILNNYAVQDGLMSLSRAAVALSVMFSYPLAFVGMKDGLFDLFRVSKKKREASGEVLTVVLLVVISAVALLVKDIQVIMSFSGATWGNCVIYIFPSAMVLLGRKKHPEFDTHVVPAALTALLGVLLGIIGVVQAANRVLSLFFSFVK